MIASPQLESERFWSKVQMGPGCWIWTGATQRRGYGHFAVGKTHYVATRWAWEQRWGEIPAGMCVLHRCDNPACVRLDHLFLGDRKDNAEDMVAKGRCRPGRPAGELNANAKLTSSQVADIRRRAVPRRVTMAQLAAEYGVSVSTIKKVLGRHAWRHVEEISA